MRSRLMCSGSTQRASEARFAAVARRTIGVSSCVRSRNSPRSSLRAAGLPACRYDVANSPHAETRDVNHSPVASRCTARIAHHMLGSKR